MSRQSAGNDRDWWECEEANTDAKEDGLGKEELVVFLAERDHEDGEKLKDTSRDDKGLYV